MYKNQTVVFISDGYYYIGTCESYDQEKGMLCVKDVAELVFFEDDNISITIAPSFLDFCTNLSFRISAIGIADQFLTSNYFEFRNRFNQIKLSNKQNNRHFIN
jgi:hypothetical protein